MNGLQFLMLSSLLLSMLLGILALYSPLLYAASPDLEDKLVESRPQNQRIGNVDQILERDTKLQYLDYDFARKYLHEAYILSQEDRSAEVQKLLKFSREYNGDQLSDYWYLLASAHEKKWEKSRSEWLEKAFEIDQWFEVPPLDAALELAHIFYHWSMYDELIRHAEQWKPEIRDNKEIQYYMALAYHNSGKDKEANNLALRNLERDGNYDERYFRILLDKPSVSKEMWVNFHFYFENNPPNSPNILRYLIAKSTDINHTENLLSIYTSLFGDDYFTTAQRTLMRQDDIVSRSNIFFSNYKTSDFLVLSKVMRYVSTVRPIETSVLELNGIYIIDQDYDGMPEEELTFINGKLTERHIFANKPEKNDVRIRWNSYGEPSSYHSFYNHNGNSQTVDILYNRYPFVQNVSVQDHDSRRVYVFSPGRLAYSLNDQNVPLNDFEWALATLRQPSLLESEVLHNSKEARLYETQLRQSDWTLRAKYEIDYLGELEKMYLDRDMDGDFDEVSYFSGGRPFKTSRDLDRDGYFELSVSYENGSPKLYEVDIDGNGAVDYTEEANRDISAKTWYTYGEIHPPESAYKYDQEKLDYLYSYYFHWSGRTVNIFAPEYLERQQ